MGKPKSALRRRAEQALVSRIAAGCSWLVQRLSLRGARRLADAAAWLIMGVFRRRQRLAEANIAAAFPAFSPAEVRRVRRESVRNICRTMVELLRLPRMSPQELQETADCTALSKLQELASGPQGVIVVSAHFGNWEWLGALMVAAGIPVYTVARDAPHSLTARLINEARASHGMKVVGREDLRTMLTVLRAGQVLGILPDQHALEGGVLLEFLGRPAWTFTGPALLAMRTGARVVPVFLARLPDGTFRVEMLPEVEMTDTGDRAADLLTNTRRINAAIEQIIRLYPGQWLWMHDRWKGVAAQTTTE